MSRQLFTCPACGKGSAGSADAEDGYCGICHAQTGIPVRLSIGHINRVIGHLDRTSTEPIGPRLIELLDAANDYMRRVVADADAWEWNQARLLEPSTDDEY